MTRTINSLFTAVLQHERVNDDCGCRVVVKCIVIAMASMCGYAGAKASQSRWMVHEIVETLRWQQWKGEYGGVDGDPGSSDGSVSRRGRRRA